MSDALRASQRHRDRFPSYLIESLNNIHHYVNYRGRTYHDLKSVLNAVVELKEMINTRLIRDFGHNSEVTKSSKDED